MLLTAVNAPNLALLMLTIGCPTAWYDAAFCQAIWLFCFTWQAVLTNRFYSRWLFRDSQPPADLPNLLSVVGWFLLSILASNTGIDAAAGLGLGAFCFGCGCFFASVVYVTILQQLHQKALKGNPATFLMLAPISVASLALPGLSGSYNQVCKALLGIAIFVLSIVAGAGPKILAEPSVLGVYWAYVFPIAALATSAVANAEVEDSVLSKALAWILMAMALLSLLVVFCRMSYHHIKVMRGVAIWNDPFGKVAVVESGAAGPGPL